MSTWDEENKAYWIKVMQDHQDADSLIQGAWFRGGRGCFFGCAMQTEDRALEKAIKQMGLPPWLVYLAEKIFEGLPSEEALAFPVKLLKAVPVGADLEGVKHRLAVARLAKLAEANPSVRECIEGVLVLHRWAELGALPSPEKWQAARSAAWSAESAAESAAWSAESAAESAAHSAWSAAWAAESETLLALLAEVGA